MRYMAAQRKLESGLQKRKRIIVVWKKKSHNIPGRHDAGLYMSYLIEKRRVNGDFYRQTRWRAWIFSKRRSSYDRFLNRVTTVLFMNLAKKASTVVATAHTGALKFICARMRSDDFRVFNFARFMKSTVTSMVMSVSSYKDRSSKNNAKDVLHPQL